MTYSIIETAKMLNVNRQTIYYWINNNKIPFELKNGKKRINEEYIQKLIKEQNYGNS